MKRILAITLCLLTILTVLSSCGGKGIQYDTIENIYKNTQTRQTVKVGGLKFDGTVRVPNVSEVYSLTLQRYDYSKQIEDFCKLFSDSFDSSLVTITDNTTFPESRYKTDSFRISAAEGGFTYCPLYDGQQDDRLMSVFGEGKRISITRPYRYEELSEEELQLQDGKMSMKQAGEQIDAFLNKKLKTVEKIYDYKIRTAFLSEYDDGTYAYEFCIERFYKGISFDSTLMYNYFSNEIETYQGNVCRVGMPLYITVCSVGGYKHWRIVPHSYNFNVISEQKLDNKFITFDGALNALSARVARNSNLTINSAEFCYDISFSSAFINENEVVMDCNAKNFTSIPVWIFTLDRENLPSSHDVHAAYMVNAVTGDVYVYPADVSY